MTERQMRPQVQIESPFMASTRDGIAVRVVYLMNAMRHSMFERGEAPYASHIINTLVTDDTSALEREIGIEAGLVIGGKADYTAVYTDLGISSGMEHGIQRAEREGRPIVYRRLYNNALSLQELEALIRNTSPRPIEAIEALYGHILR